MQAQLSRVGPYGRTFTRRVQRLIGLDTRMMASSAQEMRPVAASMKRKLEEALKPVSLNVIDESYKHAGHAGNPSGSPDAETHFKVEIVSEEFQGKNMVARHRLIYSLLADEIKNGVHALSLKTQAPSEAS